MRKIYLSNSVVANKLPTTPESSSITRPIVAFDLSAYILEVVGSGSTLSLETDGTPNGDQTLLNLVAGTGITLADNGTGNVTITNSVATPTLTEHQVAFGSHSDEITSSTDFIWNQTDANFTVGDVTNSILGHGFSSFNSGVRAGRSGIGQLFAVNGLVAVVDSTNDTIILGRSAYQEGLRLDFSNDLYTLGDVDGLTNSTTLQVDDANEVIANTANNGIQEINTTYGGDVTRIHLKVSLTADQIKTANSIPIDIGLPAAGAGYYYRVTSFDSKLNYGTQPFESENLYISSPSLFASGSALLFTKVLNKSDNQFAFSKAFNTSGFGVDYYENEILIIAADGDSATGDSTIDCYITVEKVKL